MKKGIVFNIQKFSVNDGPGIRTTVFLKGCPLNCIWCHNPESKSGKKEIFYDSRKCISCLKCVDLCQNGCHSADGGLHVYTRDKCIACAVCTQNCYADALEAVGEEKTVAEVMEEVMKDKVFYDNSGGGITLSGGEPMYQAEFTYELLKAAKEAGLHTCIETCGFASKENYVKIADYVDIFLFDCKETNTQNHIKYTWVSDELIRSNLALLSSMGKNIILRCPVIPGLNDRDDHFEAIAHIANTHDGISEINVEPYHPLGGGKAERLGVEYELKSLSFPEEETVQKWIKHISEHTDVCVKKA